MSRFRKRAPKTLVLNKFNVLNSAKYEYFTIEGSSDDKDIKYVTKYIRFTVSIQHIMTSKIEHGEFPKWKSGDDFSDLRD